MKKEDSLIPLSNNGLIKASNVIDVTQKLLSQSKHEFYNDFKGELIWELATGPITSLKIFDDALVYSNNLISQLSKAELSTGNTIQEMDLGDDNISEICFINNNKTLVAGCFAGNLIFVDTQSFQVTGKISAHAKTVDDIIPLPQNNGFATCSSDGFIKVFCGDGYQEINSIYTNDEKHSFKIILDPKNEDIIWSGGYEKLKAWDLKSSELIKEVKVSEGWFDLALDSKSNTIFIRSENNIYLFDLNSDRLTKLIETNDEIWCMSVSPDGNYLAIGHPAKVQVYETKNFSLITEFKKPGEKRIHNYEYNTPNHVHSLAFSEDSKSIACGTESENIYYFK